MSGSCLKGVWRVSGRYLEGGESMQGIKMVSRQYKDGVWRTSCSFNLRTGKVRTGQVRTGPVRKGQVKTGQVRRGQLRKVKSN